MNIQRIGARVRKLALVVGLAALTAVVAPVAGSTGRYVDATGDSGAAPDIGGVSVESDGTGQILFTIGVNDLPAVGDVEFLLMLDTDLNGATGEPDTAGSDFMFSVSPNDSLYYFGRWTGTEWDWGAPHSTVRIFSSRTGVTVSVNRSELGGTGAFNFWTRTWLGDDSDTAPDPGLWNFSVAANGPDITRVIVSAAPRSGPKAGKRFTLTPVALQLPPSAEPPLLAPRPDSYSCRAKLAGRAVKGTGTGACTWSVPKSARKQRFVAVLTVAYGGATKQFTFGYRVG